MLKIATVGAWNGEKRGLPTTDGPGRPGNHLSDQKEEPPTFREHAPTNRERVHGCKNMVPEAVDAAATTRSVLPEHVSIASDAGHI